MPLIILSELTLMSIIFNAFISRGEKSTFFASKRVKQLYSLSMKGRSPCCWVCSNSEPETSCQSLGQKANGQLLSRNHRIQAGLCSALPMTISQRQARGKTVLDAGQVD